jgi:hypothetical protein
MKDLDSYLLKCVLENLERQQAAEGLEELCACQLGIELTIEGE